MFREYKGAGGYDWGLEREFDGVYGAEGVGLPVQELMIQYANTKTLDHFSIILYNSL